MNPQRICYGCFQEKEPGVCPHCGYDDKEEQPYLALPRGTILNGRYLTGKVLGIGGFGITYLGYDLTLDIKVAIKEYMPSGMATRYTDGYTVTLTGRTEKEYAAGMERFLDEARILAKLQNLPNIVSVYNYFKENNTAYFVMEYIEGMSLKEYLAERGNVIPYTEVLAILLPVMKALCEVHSMNLIHRDISPDNIYITASGESRLLDFGAARFSLGDNKSVSVILKHGYAPEEQYSSHGNQGPWTDIYAMGATMYRCATGMVPPDSIERMRNDNIKRPSELGVRMPPVIEGAIMKALSVKTSDRYSNMEAFVEVLSGKKTASVTERVTAGVTKKAAEVAAPVSGSGRFFTMMKTNPLVRWLIIGATAAVVIFAIIFPIAGVYNPKNINTSTNGGGVSASNEEVILPSLQPDASDETIVDGTETAAPAELAVHELTGYGAEISVPQDWQQNPDTYVFSNPQTQMVVGVDLYYYTSYTPCYTLSDIENNIESTAAMAAESMSLSQYEIVSYGTTVLNNVPAYKIDLSTTNANGVSVNVVQIFAQTQNGFGLYCLTGACKGGSEQDYSALLQYMNTFSITGPADTAFRLYSNADLGFRFLYSGSDIQAGPTINTVSLKEGIPIHCVLFYPVAGDETQYIEVENITATVSTLDAAVEYYYGLYQSINVVLGEPYEEIWGGVEWTMWEGTFGENSIACAIADINGQIYVVAITALDENWDALANAMIYAMSTLRPEV